MNKKGFTLLELSVVLVIMGIVLVGFLQGNAVLLRKNKISGTKKKIETIEKALMNYLLLNEELPCPAGLKLTESSGSFGVMGNCSTNSTDGITAYNTNFIYGAVPTSTLNLANEMMKDEWGNKFSYIVHLNYTTQGTGFKNMNPDSNAISAMTYTGASSSNAITTKAVYAIISHGENGHGGWGYTSGAQASTAGESNAEELNIDEAGFDGSVAVYYYSENFDDIVSYKTKNQLIVDLDWEEIGCYIDMALLNANEPNSLCDNLTGEPSSSYLQYYDSYGDDSSGDTYDWTYNSDDQTNCCIAKCYKYGRVGYYLKGSDCN